MLDLVAEGRLVRRQGSGTYVAEPKMSWPLHLSSFTSQAAANGLVASTQLIAAERIRPDEDTAGRLGVGRGSSVFRIERLRLADDRPIALETSHLSAARFPRLTAYMRREQSLYQVLATIYHVAPASAEQSISTAPASPRVADLLRTDTGGPLLGLRPRSLHAARGPGQLVACWYPGASRRQDGTTRTLVALVAAPLEALAEQLAWIADRVAIGPTAQGHVLGAHLEGPFLSAARCGAQNPGHLLRPDTAAFARLAAAARGTLRSITIAPELPGALELIAAARAVGAVAAVGHTDATYAQARGGLDAGLRLATHLFNGMPPVHHREPGVVVAVLEGRIAVEIINDGIHIHPALIRLLAREPEQLLLVTDAISAAGTGDGTFLLGGQQAVVRDGTARLTATGTLAGSTLTMDAAVRRAVVECGLPIEVASAAASANPARVLGIGDRCGAIAAGHDADLVVLDDELRVLRVMAGGSWCDE